jgi:hypothetical protein
VKGEAGIMGVEVIKVALRGRALGGMALGRAERIVGL